MNLDAEFATIERLLDEPANRFALPVDARVLRGLIARMRRAEDLPGKLDAAFERRITFRSARGRTDPGLAERAAEMANARIILGRVLQESRR